MSESRGSAAADPTPIRFALAGLIALAAAMGIGRFVYTPILPAMVMDLQLTTAEAGLIASANYAGYLAGALYCALRPPGHSRRTLVVAALAVSALSTGAMALTADLSLIVALRFVGGVASAFVLVLLSALVLDRLAVAGRPALSGVHFAGVGIGIAISAVVVSALGYAGYGWRMQWAVSGLVAFAGSVAVPVLLSGDGPRAVAAPTPPRDHGRGLPALIIAYGLFGFGYIITATFLVALVRGSDEVRPLEPVVWLLVGLAAAPSTALWTAIAQRIGVYRAFAAAAIVEAMGVSASVLWVSSAGAIIAAIFLGGTFMGLTALGLVGARALAGGDVGRALAMMTAAFGLGQIIGPTFAGVLADATGNFTAPTIVAAAGLVVAAGFVYRIRETPKL